MQKHCKWCKKDKDINLFHKHKGMKDGRLNKCKDCVLSHVYQWRKDNPDCRKTEHVRVREKKGFKTREEYNQQRAAKAIGKKAVRLKYAHKRRLQEKQRMMNELDEFVFEQCASLTVDREEATGFKWHVDHIVPLNHKNASGLHVYSNFQVTPASWNVRKGNRNMKEFRLGDG